MNPFRSSDEKFLQIALDRSQREQRLETLMQVRTAMAWLFCIVGVLALAASFTGKPVGNVFVGFAIPGAIFLNVLWEIRALKLIAALEQRAAVDSAK